MLSLASFLLDSSTSNTMLPLQPATPGRARASGLRRPATAAAAATAPPPAAAAAPPPTRVVAALSSKPLSKPTHASLAAPPLAVAAAAAAVARLALPPALSSAAAAPQAPATPAVPVPALVGGVGFGAIMQTMAFAGLAAQPPPPPPPHAPPRSQSPFVLHTPLATAPAAAAGAARVAPVPAAPAAPVYALTAGAAAAKATNGTHHGASAAAPAAPAKLKPAPAAAAAVAPVKAASAPAAAAAAGASSSSSAAAGTKRSARTAGTTAAAAAAAAAGAGAAGGDATEPQLSTTARVLANDQADSGPAPRKRKKIYDSDEDWSGRNRKGRRKKKVQPPAEPTAAPAATSSAPATTAAAASSSSSSASKLASVQENGKPTPFKPAAAPAKSASSSAAKPKPKGKGKAKAKGKKRRRKFGDSDDDSDGGGERVRDRDADSDAPAARGGAPKRGAAAASSSLSATTAAAAAAGDGGGGARRSARLQTTAPVDYDLLTPPDHPLTLLDCEWYRTRSEQPYDVIIHTNVVLVLDVHAHMATTEVIGLLAGTYHPRTKQLVVCEAFPCTSVSTGDDERNVEMDPASEFDATRMARERGLEPVGWYHSHPTFPNNPSVTDVQNHSTRQHLFSDNKTGLPPYIGAIIAPYDCSEPLPGADIVAASSQSSGGGGAGLGVAVAPTKWFATRAGSGKTAKDRQHTPIELWSSLLPSTTVPADLLLRLRELVSRYSDWPTRTNFYDRHTVVRDAAVEQQLQALRGAGVNHMPTPAAAAGVVPSANGTHGTAAASSSAANQRRAVHSTITSTSVIAAPSPAGAAAAAGGGAGAGSGGGGAGALSGLSALAAAAAVASSTPGASGSTGAITFPPPSPLLGLSVALPPGATPSALKPLSASSGLGPLPTPQLSGLSPLAGPGASPWLAALSAGAAAAAIKSTPAGVPSRPAGIAMPSPLTSLVVPGGAAAGDVSPMVVDGAAAAASAVRPAAVQVPAAAAGAGVDGLGSPLSDSIPLRLKTPQLLDKPMPSSSPSLAVAAAAGSNGGGVAGGVLEISRFQKWQLSLLAHVPLAPAMSLDAQLALVKAIVEPVHHWTPHPFAPPPGSADA